MQVNLPQAAPCLKTSDLIQFTCLLKVKFPRMIKRMIAKGH